MNLPRRFAIPVAIFLAIGCVPAARGGDIVVNFNDLSYPTPPYDPNLGPPPGPAAMTMAGILTAGSHRTAPSSAIPTPRPMVPGAAGPIRTSMTPPPPEHPHSPPITSISSPPLPAPPRGARGIMASSTAQVVSSTSPRARRPSHSRSLTQPTVTWR